MMQIKKGLPRHIALNIRTFVEPTAHAANKSDVIIKMLKGRKGSGTSGVTVKENIRLINKPQNTK